ncbi:unnamed protein product [Meganyctiphanes norvegica]|uniref:Potassium channel domain-containing protein n=1 Tax=Meganyctiphanes norvegica TaxID=48144 RepID=A0AAV2PS70_MEGNR
MTVQQQPGAAEGDKASGAWCCSSRCSSRSWRTGPTSALLLPLHLLMVVLLCFYIVLGAAIFIQMEGEGRTSNEPTEDTWSWVTREELVERNINKSMETILEKSQDTVIFSIFSSPRMQEALRAFRAVALTREPDLPSDLQLKALSDDVMRDLKEEISNDTKKFQTFVTRRALGFRMGKAERNTIWSSSKEPPSLPWDFWPSIMHSFCLLTTIGGGINAETPGGRAVSIMYAVIGGVLYMFVVTVWAARLNTALAHFIKMFSNAKVVDTSVSEKKSQRPTVGPRQRNPLHGGMGMLICSMATTIYTLAMSVAMGGREDYAKGLENTLLCFLLIKPPTPLPESPPEVSCFIAIVLVGHIIIVSTISIFKGVCNRWWTTWGWT